MSEDQIERRVERRIDELDRQYLAGQFSEAEYNQRVRDIDTWARAEYNRA